MNYFACHYTYANEAPEVVRLRPEHREFLGTLMDEGKLVGSGPYVDGHGSALIIIRLPEPSTVDDAYELMDADPFHVNDVLAGREIRAWNPVMNVFK